MKKIDIKKIAAKHIMKDFEVLEAINTGLKKANQLSTESFSYIQYRDQMKAWLDGGKQGIEPTRPAHMQDSNTAKKAEPVAGAVEHFESSVKQHFTKK